MAILGGDDRYRAVLDRKVRKFLKVRPRSKVLTIPSSEGVLMILLQERTSTLLSPDSAIESRLTKLLASYSRRTRLP